MINTLDFETFSYYIKDAIRWDKINFLGEITDYIRYPLKITKAKEEEKYLKLWIKNAYSRFISTTLFEGNPNKNISKKVLLADKSRLRNKIIEIILASGEEGIHLSKILKLAWAEYVFDKATYVKFVRRILRDITYGYIENVQYLNKKYHKKEK